jgi:hypothetical protein
MSDQDQGTLVQGQEPTATVTEPGQTQSITKEMLDKLLADQETKFQGLIAATEENYKTQLKGVNQKNTEYKKQLDAKLTEDERLQAEKAEAIEEANKAREAAEKWKRDHLISKGLSEAELPQTFNEFITGNNEQEITEKVTKLKTYIDGLVTEKSEKSVKEALGGAAPKGGSNPTVLNERAKLEAAYTEAQKAGNGTLMLQIKEQLRKMLDKK